jgi:hypothetical protein
VTDDGLKHFKELKELSCLMLCYTSISGRGLAELGALTELKVLWLDDAQINDEGLRHIGRLTSLTTLKLGGTKITDTGLAHLKRLQELEFLSLERTAVTDKGLRELSALRNVQRLDLTETGVTNDGLALLSGWSKLERLYVRRTRVDETGAKLLQRSLPKLHISVDSARKGTKSGSPHEESVRNPCHSEFLQPVLAISLQPGHEKPPLIEFEVGGPVSSLQGSLWPKGSEGGYKRSFALSKQGSYVVSVGQGTAIRIKSSTGYLVQEEGRIWYASFVPYRSKDYAAVVGEIERIGTGLIQDRNSSFCKTIGEWKKTQQKKDSAFSVSTGGKGPNGSDVRFELNYHPESETWYFLLEISKK